MMNTRSASRSSSAARVLVATSAASRDARSWPASSIQHRRLSTAGPARRAVLVMERRTGAIDGRDAVACDRRALRLPRRLRRRATPSTFVVHRDIKPSNVLVTLTARRSCSTSVFRSARPTATCPRRADRQWTGRSRDTRVPNSRGLAGHDRDGRLSWASLLYAAHGIGRTGWRALPHESPRHLRAGAAAASAAITRAGGQRSATCLIDSPDRAAAAPSRRLRRHRADRAAQGSRAVLQQRREVVGRHRTASGAAAGRRRAGSDAYRARSVAARLRRDAPCLAACDGCWRVDPA